MSYFEQIIERLIWTGLEQTFVTHHEKNKGVQWYRRQNLVMLEVKSLIGFLSSSFADVWWIRRLITGWFRQIEPTLSDWKVKAHVLRVPSRLSHTDLWLSTATIAFNIWYGKTGQTSAFFRTCLEYVWPLPVHIYGFFGDYEVERTEKSFLGCQKGLDT